MKSVILCAVAAASLCAVSSVRAQETAAPPEGPIEVIRSGDTTMTCAAVSEEAAQLSQTMGGEPDGGLFGRLGGVARVGAAMLIPGAGLAMAGADVVTAPGRERKAAEADAIRHRWYYLNGLYAGQGCQAASDAAGPTPASPADAAPPVEPES